MYDPAILGQLSICNIWGLLRASTGDGVEWRQVLHVAKGSQPPTPAGMEVAFPPSISDVKVYFNHDTWGLGLVSFKMVSEIDAPPEEVFECVKDL
eukprot:CAMPEP_0182585042 /NCGR_PEP_ID=MMETSP1324-20130603/59333_1 /TAXON_ID=236786 /ORGANISM="Florenciella sp., Strain RCC1587" /LENGTH=94 /DNA_ID=CAMNT_0024801813 /DNA_START=11 /DNA_END=292 /DNA_ORIENTATION=+